MTGLQNLLCSGICPGAPKASTTCDSLPTPASSPTPTSPTPAPTTDGNTILLAVIAIVSGFFICAVGGCVYFTFFSRGTDRTRVAASESSSAVSEGAPKKMQSQFGKNNGMAVVQPGRSEFLSRAPVQVKSSVNPSLLASADLGRAGMIPRIHGSSANPSPLASANLGSAGMIPRVSGDRKVTGFNQHMGYASLASLAGGAQNFATQASGTLGNGQSNRPVEGMSLASLSNGAAFNGAQLASSRPAFTGNVANAAMNASGMSLATGYMASGGVAQITPLATQQLLLQQLATGKRESGSSLASYHPQNSWQMSQSSGMLSAGALNAEIGGTANLGTGQLSQYGVYATDNDQGAYAEKDVLKLWTRFQVRQEEVVIGDRLGRGAFGSVYKCIFRGDDKCAIKRLDMTLNTKARTSFLKEIKIMCTLSHPCTVRLYAWTPQPLAVIMELAACDLSQYYKKKKLQPYSLEKALRVCIDAAKGMMYIHSTGLIHRDLKSMNIMITEDVSCLLALAGDLEVYGTRRLPWEFRKPLTNTCCISFDCKRCTAKSPIMASPESRIPTIP